MHSVNARGRNVVLGRPSTITTADAVGEDAAPTETCLIRTAAQGLAPERSSSARADRIRMSLFFLAGLVLFCGFLFVTPIRTGDAYEYFAVTEAWFNHGSPDVRQGDLDTLALLLEANGIAPIPSRIKELGISVPSPKGYSFGIHFWLYPLSAVPAKAVLHVLRRNELAAHQLTNVIWYLSALYVALFRGGACWRWRLVFAGLAGVSPVLWYLRWATPEVFTWSLVLIALTNLSSARYAWAALCAALAATQNPPVLFLGFFAAQCSVGARSFRLTALACACASLCFVPNLWSLYFWGVLNPLIGVGGTSFQNISLARTWSLFTDFNQGILPFMPAVIPLAGAGVCRVLISRNLKGLGTLGVILLMVLSCEPIINWNDGAALLKRYAVWVIPVLTWFLAESLANVKFITAVVVAELALQAGIVLQHDGTESYSDQSWAARFVLTRLPSLYDPDPEIFYERQYHTDSYYRAGEPPPFRDCLPIPFITTKGAVTKLLLDAECLSRLGEDFDVDRQYLDSVQKKYSRRAGLFYLTPPPKSIRPKPDAELTRALEGLRLGLVDLPQRITSRTFTVNVSLSNQSDCAFLDRPTDAVFSKYLPNLLLSYGVHQDGREIFTIARRSTISQTRLRPGDTITVPVEVELPVQSGRIELAIMPLLENIAWGRSSALKLYLDARTSSDQRFAAEVVHPD